MYSTATVRKREATKKETKQENANIKSSHLRIAQIVQPVQLSSTKSSLGYEPETFFRNAKDKLSYRLSSQAAASKFIIRIFFVPNSMNISMHWFDNKFFSDVSLTWVNDRVFNETWIKYQFRIRKYYSRRAQKLKFGIFFRPNSMNCCMHCFIHRRNTIAGLEQS